LRALGVADVVLASGFAPSRGEVRRMDGTVLKRIELPSANALGARVMVALRPALHGALLDAVGIEAVSFSSGATGFTLHGNRVTLHTARGDAESDLLVGADGVSSVVRRALHPSEPSSRSSGIVAVRGMVHGVLDLLGDLSAVYYLGRGVECALVRASDTGIYWYLSLAQGLVPSGTRDPAAILAQVSPRFDATFQAITSATEDLRFDELVDRDPIPFWGKAVVTLLGDAAHPLLPHTGQGAAQAMIDAVTLGNALGRGADVERGLKSYERERRGKTGTLLAQGRRTARILGTTNAVACVLREVVVRLMPVQSMVQVVLTINRRAGTDIPSQRSGDSSWTRR
jgi:5-methylphenazine-1-carboxylate 1-monooxygenase